MLTFYFHFFYDIFSSFVYLNVMFWTTLFWYSLVNSNVYTLKCVTKTLLCKHTMCTIRWSDAETVVSTSFQRGIHVVCWVFKFMNLKSHPCINKNIHFTKKLSFLLDIFLVNVTKSAASCGLGHITEEILNRKHHFFCAVTYVSCYD